MTSTATAPPPSAQEPTKGSNLLSRTIVATSLVAVGIAAFTGVKAWRRSAEEAERSKWWETYRHFESNMMPSPTTASPVAPGSESWAKLNGATRALEEPGGLAKARLEYSALAREHGGTIAADGLVAGLGAARVAESIEALAKWEESHPALTELPPPATEGRARVVVPDAGTIEIGFYPDAAPRHVENFRKLVADGFFAGTKFHRVVSSGIHIVQGGDPNTKEGAPETWGMGGTGDGVEIEHNKLAHLRGAVAMAQPGSGSEGKSSGCQFYIVTKPSPSLDRRYTVFGRVVNGMEAVDKIAAGEVTPPDRPKAPFTISACEIVN